MRTYHLLNDGVPMGRLLIDESGSGYAVLNCLPKPLTVIPKAPGERWTAVERLNRDFNRTQSDLARIGRELGRLLSKELTTGTPAEEVAHLRRRRASLRSRAEDTRLAPAHLRRERRGVKNCIRLASAKESGNGLG